MIKGTRMMMKRRGAPLPYDAEVEYLESTGTQYIDTGILCTSLPDEFIVRCGLSANSLGTYYETFFGAEKNTSGWPAVYWRIQPYNDDGPGRQFKSGVGTFYNWSPVEPHVGIDYEFVLDVQTSGVKYTINSVETRFNYSDRFRIPFDLYLFCLNNNGNADRFANLDMRYFSIDDICDMIPIRFTNELGQSEGAMYDRVSGQLFRNAGTGAFTIGPDKS